MKALILAGGFGTRLRPLTEQLPKSLVSIGNKPFLEHQIALLARHGIREVTLLTGYLADDFTGFLPRAAALGVEVKIATEDAPLGTAGAVRNASDGSDGTTIVLNGDVLTDLDLTAVLETHRSTGSRLSIVLHHVTDATAYGLVEHEEATGRISAFLEKDPVKGKAGGWINAGTYVLEPEAFDAIPRGKEWSFEYQVFPGLLEKGVPMFAFRSESYWLDIGTRERVLKAHADLAHGRAKFSIDGRIVGSASFDDGTVIYGPSILSHAKVAPGAVIGPETSLGPNCSIGEGAVVERSVVMAGAQVGESARVSDSIIGPGVTVEASAELKDQIVS